MRLYNVLRNCKRYSQSIVIEVGDSLFDGGASGIGPDGKGYIKVHLSPRDGFRGRDYYLNLSEGEAVRLLDNLRELLERLDRIKAHNERAGV